MTAVFTVIGVVGFALAVGLLTMGVFALGKALTKSRGMKILPGYIHRHGGRFLRLDTKFRPYTGGIFTVTYWCSSHGEVRAECLLIEKNRIYWLRPPPGLDVQ